MFDLGSKGHCIETRSGFAVSLGKKFNPLLYFCVNPGLQKKNQGCVWVGGWGMGGTLIVTYDT